MREFELNNGIKIPAIGMGGWAQKKYEIIAALNVGYRLLDTAAQYGNEEEFGDAILESGIPRSDIFLTSKLWTEDIRRRRVKEAFFESLSRLKTDYIDMYLIHWPAEGFEEAWQVMGELYKDHRIRAIGVSNFERNHLERLKKHGASIVPVINQVESHPYFSNNAIIDYCSNNGMISEAWCPLGGPNNSESRDERIIEIAREHEKTPQQIILRWHFQRGVITIPKTSRIERMIDNINIFDFELNSYEMEAINRIDKNQRIGADPNNFDF